MLRLLSVFSSLNAALDVSMRSDNWLHFRMFESADTDSTITAPAPAPAAGVDVLDVCGVEDEGMDILEGVCTANDRSVPLTGVTVTKSCTFNSLTKHPTQMSVAEVTVIFPPHTTCTSAKGVTSDRRTDTLADTLSRSRVNTTPSPLPTHPISLNSSFVRYSTDTSSLLSDRGSVEAEKEVEELMFLMPNILLSNFNALLLLLRLSSPPLSPPSPVLPLPLLALLRLSVPLTLRPTLSPSISSSL